MRMLLIHNFGHVLGSVFEHCQLRAVSSDRMLTTFTTYKGVCIALVLTDTALMRR